MKYYKYQRKIVENKFKIIEERTEGGWIALVAKLK